MGSGKVSIFEYMPTGRILCLILSEKEEVLFSGGEDSTIMQHSTKTLKSIGQPLELDIDYLNGIDLNSNLLVVGGFHQFKVIKLEKLTNSGGFQIHIDLMLLICFKNKWSIRFLQISLINQIEGYDMHIAANTQIGRSMKWLGNIMSVNLVSDFGKDKVYVAVSGHESDKTYIVDVSSEFKFPFHWKDPQRSNTFYKHSNTIL